MLNWQFFFNSQSDFFLFADLSFDGFVELASFQDSAGYFRGYDFDSPYGIVISRDAIGDQIGVSIGVHYSYNWYAEAISLFYGQLFFDYINNVEHIG